MHLMQIRVNKTNAVKVRKLHSKHAYLSLAQLVNLIIAEGLTVLEKKEAS